MGSSAQQFTNIAAVAERIEQGVRSGKIYAPTEKKGFKGKRREVDHVEGDYRVKKYQFQNYHTLPQIANINFNPSFPTRKPDPQIKNQTKSFQRVLEQLPPLPLPLNGMYQKLFSIVHVAPKPFAPLQPPYLNWYKPDLTCKYHTSATGHNIHTCSAFKKKLM